MRRSRSIQYLPLPSDDYTSDENDDSSQSLIQAFDIDSSQVGQPNFAQELKGTELLIQALVRGENRTYAEKISLALRSSILALPLFFVNGSFIFIDMQKKLETTMENNVYYKRYFNKLIKTLSYEGSIVSAEASAMTTASVFLTILITGSTLAYQGLRYHTNKQKMKRLVAFLEEQNIEHADQLLSYPLSASQLTQIQDLIKKNQINEETVIAAEPSPLEKWVSDLLWFHDETNKYLTPFLLFSLIPGFTFMYQVAKNLEDDLNCSQFPLWSLLFEVCPPLQKVELMSLLTYLWGSFSATYLLGHSLALTARLALSPFASIRQRFQEKINKPFSQWLAENQHYETLIQKSLSVTVLPLISAYSLYRSIQFTNTYLAETGCSNLGQALSKPFFPGTPYPCSMAQAALGFSVLMAEFEFDHVYPAYLAIKAFSILSAQVIKPFAYFKQEAMLLKVKKILSDFSSFESKMLPAVGMGVILGGAVALLPSYRISNTILQKEGFELFFPLNNMTAWTNLSVPEVWPASLPFDFDELVNHVPACSLNTVITIPDFPLGNDSFPGFNTTLPCVETFFDVNSNMTIMGLQITPPCPSENLLSAFYRNLLHIPPSCDPVLLVRSFASFVVPFWLGVNVGAGLSISLAAASLFTLWARQNLRKPAHQDPQASYSHRLFSSRESSPCSSSQRSVESSPELPAWDSSENDLGHQPPLWFKIKQRIFSFFSTPQPPQPANGSRRPLLEPSRPTRSYN